MRWKGDLLATRLLACCRHVCLEFLVPFDNLGCCPTTIAVPPWKVPDECGCDEVAGCGGEHVSGRSACSGRTISDILPRTSALSDEVHAENRIF